MADWRSDPNTYSIQNPDILSTLLQQNVTNEQVLKSIDTSLKRLIGDANKISASNARNKGYTSDLLGLRGGPFKTNRFSKGAFSDFSDALERELINGLVGTDFKKQIANIRDKFAADIGVAFDEIPSALGKAAGKQIMNAFSNSDLGKSLIGSVRGEFKSLLTHAGNKYARGVENYMRQNGNLNYVYNGAFNKNGVKDIADTVRSAEKIAKVASKVTKSGSSGGSLMESISPELFATISGGAAETTTALSGVTEAATATSTAMAGASSSAIGAEASMAGLAAVSAEAIPVAGVLIASAIGLVEITKWMIGPGVKGIKSAVSTTIESANRFSAVYNSNIKDAKARIKSDVEYMVKQPFEILKKGAEEWYAAWDNNLRTITATQGYTKADVQELASSFATRLREENLTSVVSSSDMLNNLSKVLSSGLSGKAAEEFSYIATILNATIPTQDFFSYAADYASIAANAMNQGKSQAEALSIANEQLTAFANNILSASRATGGLTTGLQSAEGIFKQSVQIAQAAKTNNSSAISGVLATVAAVTGAIAPDLASSMTDALYNAAVGGNSSSIVALRSLAGINASNTEFLLQLSKNPQKVFGDVFSKLAEMQNMSPGAFMEVAEGLSETFGISASAFARVDFNALATAIKNYNNSSNALSENIALLMSGETTTTAEQLKNAEINKMILDEGLSLVLDNDAARAIQQHMWDEQIAQKITEATYAINIEGAALTAIMGIKETLGNVYAFMHGGFLYPNKNTPFIADIKASIDESQAIQADIAKMLEIGKVGRGNGLSYYQLTTVDRTYDLVDSLVDMMGGTSSYTAVNRAYKASQNQLRSPRSKLDYAMFGASGLLFSSDFWNPNSDVSDAVLKTYANQIMGGPSTTVSSKYNWGSIGKSSVTSVFSNYVGETASALASAVLTSSSTAAQTKATGNIERMLNTMNDFVKDGGTFSEFVATAKDFGISNFTDALESAGYSATEIEGQFGNIQAQLASKAQYDRNKTEETFWETTTNYLDTLSSDVSKYLSEWEDYYISHTVYNNAYTRDTVDRIMREERESSESAIYALADALTENNVDLLVDPTLQTNALLSQILKVANAILNQQSTGGNGVSLPDTIAGLSLGLINM